MQMIVTNLNTYDVPVIANIAGSTIEEYEDMTRALKQTDYIKAIELNISWPNVKEGSVQLGMLPEVAQKVTRCVKVLSSVPVY